MNLKKALLSPLQFEKLSPLYQTLADYSVEVVRIKINDSLEVLEIPYGKVAFSISTMTSVDEFVHHYIDKHSVTTETLKMWSRSMDPLEMRKALVIQDLLTMDQNFLQKVKKNVSTSNSNSSSADDSTNEESTVFNKSDSSVGECET